MRETCRQAHIQTDSKFVSVCVFCVSVCVHACMCVFVCPGTELSYSTVTLCQIRAIVPSITFSDYPPTAKLCTITQSCPIVCLAHELTIWFCSDPDPVSPQLLFWMQSSAVPVLLEFQSCVCPAFWLHLFSSILFAVIMIICD